MRLQGEGVGSRKWQAEVIMEEEKEQLWRRGILGDHTLQSLLDTMVFCIGLYFALRNGKEHRQLRQNLCQIELVEHPGERPFLKYTEDVSKIHPGGLKGRDICRAPAGALQISRPNCLPSQQQNPERCFDSSVG